MGKKYNKIDGCKFYERNKLKISIIDGKQMKDREMDGEMG